MPITGRPKGTKKLSDKQISDLLDAYLQQCKDNNKAVTITGFLIFANISKDTLSRYGQLATYSAAVKKLHLHAENCLIDKLLNENKPIGSIFLLKANFGYIEQQKLDVTSNGQTLGVIELPHR